MVLLRVLVVAGQIADVSAGITALVVLGLPVLVLGALAVLYGRTRVEIRRRELAPPLYFLTLINATASGESAAPANEPDQEDLELDRGRRREIAGLRRRGTHLLFALGADAIVLWLATAWYVREIRSAEGAFRSAETFTSVERLPAAAPDTLTTDLAANTPHITDSERGAPKPEPAPLTVRPQPPVSRDRPAREAPREPSVTARRPPGTERSSPAETPPASSTARLDTTVTAPAVRADSAAPAPEAVRAVPLPPTPDPVNARANAERALDIAARHVVRELNAHRPVAAAGSGDAAMGKLAEWLRNQRPSVSPGTLVDVVVEGPSGEAILPVTLRWRDDFGVGKQRSLRLRISVQREADDWVFSSAELLERFP